MTMHETVIEKPADLDELCGHIREQEEFGFDTEFVTEDTYVPELCLVQVATRERLVLIDPMAIGDLGAFWELVAGPPGRVVAHAADAEIRFCRHFAGRAAAPIFDVQIAAAFAGYGYKQSYTNLVRRVLGQYVRGSETRTEWRRRPLSAKQIEYALEDVRHLLTLSGKLRDELDAAGRLEWAADEFHLQVQERPSSEPWRRVSGVTSLGRKQLAVLRELAAWREAEARSRNRPIRSVANDDILIELAKRQPTDERDLLIFRGMNRRNLRRVTDQLLGAIRRGLDVPESQWPSLPSRPEDSDRVRILTGVLNAALAARCAQVKLPPALVATTGDLAAFIRDHFQNQPPHPDSPLAAGWRRDMFGQLLADLLDGKLSLRIAQPHSEMPLRIEPAAPEA